MSRKTRVVLSMAGCALLAIAVAAWVVSVRAPWPETAAPASGVAAPARADALVLEGVADPVAPPTASAERSVPVEIAEGTASASARRATLVVRVKSVETGEPVAGVRINAREDSEEPRFRAEWATTGLEGLGEFDVTTGVEVVVRAAADLRRNSSAESRVPALAPGERREVVLAVHTQEDVVVHGIVLRGDTREGVAGVVVQAILQNPIHDGPETITANDGTFRLALRSYATKELVYSHAQFGTARSGYQGHESPTTPVVVLLEPGASILANVVDVDGEPTKWWTVAAAEIDPVFLDSGPTSSRSRFYRALSTARPAGEVSATVSEGSAEVVGLKAGRPLALEVRRGDRVVWHSRTPLVLAPGERRAVAIRVGGASLHGFVRDTDGRPLAGIELSFQAADEQESGYAGSGGIRAGTKSAADGSYRIGGLEPGVWLVGTGNRIEAHVVRLDRKESVRVVDRVVLHGGPESHDFVIARGLRISGRVLGADGVGVEGASISAQAGSDPSFSRTSSGAEGNFELEVPRAGTWTVQAELLYNGASAPVATVAGTRDLVLRIERCARLELELVDAEGEPVDPDSVQLVRADGIPEYPYSGGEHSGFWSADCQRPGTFHVVVANAQDLYGTRRDLALVAGSTTSAKIVLSPGGQARVRFEGPGDTGSLRVLDHGVIIRRTTLLRGIPTPITGPLGEVELQLQVGGTRHDRRLVLKREPGLDVVFDGGWR